MSPKSWYFFRQSLLGQGIRKLFPNWLVNYLWHLPKAIFANLRYGFPARRLFVIGVTGTDGKTTVANLIYEILRSSRQKAALISTVCAKIGSQEIPTGLHTTSPDPLILQGLIKKISQKKISYLVLEVTSHGLDQFRFFGIPFQVGVITNLTPEHLDYHQTFANYLAAKAKLFQKVKIAVLNRDDQSFPELDSVRPRSSQLLTYSLKKGADYTPQNYSFKTKLPGQYNQANALAAIAVAKALKISDRAIKKALASFSGVPGRAEAVKLGQDFEVFIDFAHTPNALKEVLITFKKQTKNRLIAVFGCAGLRDCQKRPLMGQIAASLADLVVLTAEDPRTENVDQIIDQIAQGAFSQRSPQGDWLFKIPDRREAIQFTLQNLAQKDDLVLVLGKGHEKSICYGQTEYPWSDREEVKKALQKNQDD